MHDAHDEMLSSENWDFAAAKVVEPAKSAGAVVSVRFAREDLAAISKAAAESGLKTSEFIRCAALEKAAHEARVSVLNVSPAAGPNVRTVDEPNWRRTYGSGRFRTVLQIINGVRVETT